MSLAALVFTSPDLRLVRGGSYGDDLAFLALCSNGSALPLMRYVIGACVRPTLRLRANAMLLQVFDLQTRFAMKCGCRNVSMPFFRRLPLANRIALTQQSTPK
jgi:hypothetical protein